MWICNLGLHMAVSVGGVLHLITKLSSHNYCGLTPVAVRSSIIENIADRWHIKSLPWLTAL